MSRRLSFIALVLGTPLVLQTTVVVGAQPDYQPAVLRLGSAAGNDRAAALRDLTRLRPPAATARPLLEKMLADPAPEVRVELSWSIRELLGAGGTDLLEKLYSNTEAPVRQNAIRAACRMWDQEAARAFCRAAFSDPDQTTRVDVLVVLRDAFPQNADAVLLFREGLRDRSELVQRAAVFAAQAARDSGAVSELGRLARTASDLVAEPAAGDALPTIGSPEAVDELVALLPRPRVEPGKIVRPSDQVRAAAVRALERIRDPRSAAKLRPLLSDPSPLVRGGVLCALAQMRDRAAAPLVAAQLHDKDPGLRELALRALRRIGAPAGDGEIRQALHDDPEPVVRAAAASTLADLRGAAAIPDLAQAGADRVPAVRYEAAAALAGLGRPAAPALIGYLGDADPSVRGMAVIGLSQIGGPEVVAALQHAATDGADHGINLRMAVAEALGMIGRPDALPTLITFSADTEPGVRQAAAVALGRIGGPRAIKTLQSLVADPAPRVRYVAARALRAASGAR